MGVRRIPNVIDGQISLKRLQDENRDPRRTCSTTELTGSKGPEGNTLGYLDDYTRDRTFRDFGQWIFGDTLEQGIVLTLTLPFGFVSQGVHIYWRLNQEIFYRFLTLQIQNNGQILEVGNYDYFLNDGIFIPTNLLSGGELEVIAGITRRPPRGRLVLNSEIKVFGKIAHANVEKNKPVQMLSAIGNETGAGYRA
ncbi:MAG: hypothetical protein Q8O94_02765 [bacterium]|nr:hypothetical protein [bacterium]